MSLQEEYYKTALQQIKRGHSKGKVSNAKIYYLLSVVDRIDVSGSAFIPLYYKKKQ